MTSPYTKEAMRARMVEVRAQADAIRAVSEPMREHRDRVVQAAREEEARMNAEIKAAETGLGALEQEYSNLARAVGGLSVSANG